MLERLGVIKLLRSEPVLNYLDGRDNIETRRMLLRIKLILDTECLSVKVSFCL